MTPNNEIISSTHWRIQRRVKTDLRQYYRDENHTDTIKDRMYRTLTIRYSILLYCMLTDHRNLTKLIHNYYRTSTLAALWHSKEDQKYTKYSAIWMCANGYIHCPHIPIPLDVRIRIVKRLNKMIDDKKTKLFIPVDKKFLA